MEKELIFYKEFQGAISPERGTEQAAGIDFFIPRPESMDDRCYSFMREKCLSACSSDDERKTVNARFDFLMTLNNPKHTYWGAVLIYNKYVFGHAFRNAMPSTMAENITLEPGEGITIPSGISVDIPDGYAIDFRNKSGIASKQDLLVGAQLIDSDYTGVVHYNLHNVGKQARVLSCGQKIVQGVLIETHWAKFDVKTVDGHINKDSDRGEGGFGSTGV